MSLPSLLLVDDSDAILALERAILSGHYTIHTASNGREALEKVGRLRPAAVLLDLSMPEMDGDEVLQRMKADPATADIPVIIISSEKSRAEACLGLGAEAFLAKPFRADELLQTVGEAMTSARQRARTGSLLVLRVTVGELEFAIPLDAVREVLLHPATRPLPTGPAYLREYVEVRGAALCVLDVARRLGVEHKLTRVERMLVVIEADGVSLALAVDTVKDPEEYASADIDRRERVGGADHGPLRDGLIGMLRSGGRSLPILDPRVFIARGLLRELPAMLEAAEAGRNA
ncbi:MULTISPECIES: response regulator [Myxococcus]|uniref:Chemotaxis protein CheW n=1 Tax=Myxococcus xanthus TaxID=34 RepID=A0AAE6G504_MYXXA|nr:MULTISPECIES: response regulator [Myxococcus]QDE70902.1 chemotaxis protein CheW [Myxococcus xanthus]QDE78180.1 chemotaxis protein CheW [Myxococcus xanthus]QDE85565.1 chemotaxis protein CheW [Myxococcus xanthus]QDE99724.1 chemotaxis protein CheW [Myxococcus xanthus]QDF07455.1 chemotaxis protein CheW [Myxococcus xanthus]